MVVHKLMLFPDSIGRERNAFDQSLEGYNSATPIHIRDVYCRNGTEDQLLDCDLSLGNDSCYHYQDVGVTCTSNEDQLPGNSASIEQESA